MDQNNTSSGNNENNNHQKEATSRRRSHGGGRGRGRGAKRQQQQHHHHSGGGGRHGKGGGARHNKGNKQLSHALSWALRHAAVELDLTMTPDGFVPLAEILSCPHKKLRGYTEEQVRQVVAENDKQRFSLLMKPASDYYDKNDSNSKEEGDQRKKTATAAEVEEEDSKSPKQTADNKEEEGTSSANLSQTAEHGMTTTAETNTKPIEGMIWCIRANQGHSLAGIDPHLLLQRLQPAELQALPVIVHGTYEAAWRTIQTTGYLSRMKRNHIHFAAGLPGQDGVISGMRRSCQILVYVDAARCARDGIVFFRSDNGVLLTAGVNEQGQLPLEYVSHVTNAASDQVLFRRGGES